MLYFYLFRPTDMPVMLVRLLTLICHLIFRVNINGLANLPQQGKLLAVTNHESFLGYLLINVLIQTRPAFVLQNN